MTAVEWLAEKYNEVNWLRNRDEISSKYADELREVFFYQAKEIENKRQGYSEEEVIELLQKALTHKDDGEIGSLVTAQGQIRTANFFSWFEQFKKKII